LLGIVGIGRRQDIGGNGGEPFEIRTDLARFGIQAPGPCKQQGGDNNADQHRGINADVQTVLPE
jgi:hypothetical protein